MATWGGQGLGSALIRSPRSHLLGCLALDQATGLITYHPQAECPSPVWARNLTVGSKWHSAPSHAISGLGHKTGRTQQAGGSCFRATPGCCPRLWCAIYTHTLSHAHLHSCARKVCPQQGVGDETSILGSELKLSQLVTSGPWLLVLSTHPRQSQHMLNFRTSHHTAHGNHGHLSDFISSRPNEGTLKFRVKATGEPFQVQKPLSVFF